ncbi:VTT domain-containing protein [Corynebacterium phoceense]|uniref:DedA family protein n=1 Tax=Corynebacterium phoceense TaxID=1686286 RepID=UPI00211CECD0|nr:VTT domain-containing protein [Corynebacterium phoceense]MCQ9330880.1 VTT domain-containing protein [Corynebacterium phoceense]MCQ9339699.1 VTT domain-containing protein [Corynebacterium phoceense]MCQ9347944.1 VTT domain-containing protein [Corynebacterium phoceense]
MSNLTSYLDAATLLEAFGPWVIAGIALVVFIESGVLFPFLPGDSLLVTAAVLRDQLNVSIWALLTVGFVAAFLGDQVGFWLGHKFGRKLFKADARLLKLQYLHAAEDFFAKHGPAALVLGRFVPIVRTYVPVAAGTAQMPYRHFIGWNVAGAALWVLSMNLVGVFLGNIPGIADSIEKIMLLIIFISVAPIIIKALYERHKLKKRATIVEETPAVLSDNTAH